MGKYPSFLNLLDSGELERRVEKSWQHLKNCDICPRNCGINRLAGETGFCRSGVNARVTDYGPHFGEEAPLTGRNGSGTIFFNRCNLHCIYCQNYQISQFDGGAEVDGGQLGQIMLDLQARGCHNINLVTPTHMVPQILACLFFAAKSGLSIPLVYNTGGYDSLEMLAYLDGVVDIYLPDMKYSDASAAQKYSGIKDYPFHNRVAVKEMYRQVGDLKVDENGIAVSGLLIRHLVLPDHLAGSQEILHFIAKELSVNTHINIMDQYSPHYQAKRTAALGRPITLAEYREVIEMAHRENLYYLE